MIRLTNRERHLAAAVAVFILVYGCYTLALKPAIERTRTLKRVIPEKQQALAEIKTKSDRYLSLQNKLKDLRQRVDGVGQKFELLAFLESMTTQKGLTKKVGSMKQYTSKMHSGYSQTIVELKLQNIPLPQLIDLLLEVKTSDNALWINSLHAKKSISDPASLETTIQISTLTAQNP